MARPSSKPENLIELVTKYLSECKDSFTSEGNKVNLPTIEGLALYLGFNKTTMYEWAKTDTEFSNSLGIIKDEQKKRLLSEGLAGNYNSTIAKLILSANHGMVEKKEVDQTHRYPDEVKINFIEPDND